MWVPPLIQISSVPWDCCTVTREVRCTFTYKDIYLICIKIWYESFSSKTTKCIEIGKFSSNVLLQNIYDMMQYVVIIENLKKMFY